MNYDQFIKRIKDCYPNEKKPKQKEIPKQEKDKPKNEKVLSDSRNIDRQFVDTNR